MKNPRLENVRLTLRWSGEAMQAIQTRQLSLVLGLKRNYNPTRKDGWRRDIDSSQRSR
jgi:hypothetical protein